MKNRNQPKEAQVQFRQGDVLIVRVNEIPREAPERKPEAGRVVLAYGEVTGHAHAFYGGVRWFAPNDQGVGYIEVEGEEPALLKHEEHTAIPVPPGKYRYTRQREYVAPEIQRAVAD